MTFHKGVHTTKTFCSIFVFCSILSKAYANLDFETKTVKICCKLSDMYYFEVDHSKFYKPLASFAMIIILVESVQAG